MIDKARWLKIWGFVEGTPEGEAAWLNKLAPRRIGAPMIRRDTIAPCLGMDGKMHDSLSSYRRTLREDGNPQGEAYIELGNESLKPKTFEFDRAQRRDDIKAAISDVKNGRVPPLTVLEDTPNV